MDIPAFLEEQVKAGKVALLLGAGASLDAVDRDENHAPSTDQLRDMLRQILGALPEMQSIFAERVAEGLYINIEVNRAEAARYWLTVGDVQRVITSGIGGDNIAENVEGRERYPISVRYAADFRDNLDKLRQILVATPSNGQVPLGDLAKFRFREAHR